MTVIRHVRHEKGNGVEMHAAMVSGIVTLDVPVSYWSIFSLSLVTVPEVFAKVNSTQFPFFFLQRLSRVFTHFE